jgi:hypothetical protein
MESGSRYLSGRIVRVPKELEGEQVGNDGSALGVESTGAVKYRPCGDEEGYNHAHAYF